MLTRASGWLSWVHYSPIDSPFVIPLLYSDVGPCSGISWSSSAGNQSSHADKLLERHGPIALVDGIGRHSAYTTFMANVLVVLGPATVSVDSG